MINMLAEATAVNLNAGLAVGGAMLGAGIGVGGAGRGIGQIGGMACEAIARQPEARGSIGTNMIISAALIEGFTFFGLILALVVYIGFKP